MEAPSAQVRPEAGSSTGVGTHAATHEATSAGGDSTDDDPRGFKFRERKVGVGLGGIWDPDLDDIKVKVKREQPTLAKVEDQASAGPPAWTTRGWNKAGEKVKREVKVEDNHAEVMKREESPPSAPQEAGDAQSKSHIKEEEPDVATSPAEPPPTGNPNGAVGNTPPPSAGNLFRKRKAPSATANRGSRRKI